MNLPASGTAVDGQIVVIAIISSAPGGAPSAPNLTVAPGAGNQMSDLNNPGAVLATATASVVTTQGADIWLKYRSATVTPFTAPGWIEIV